MRLNKLTCGILLAMSAIPLYSSAATLSANDQTNTISGLDSSMMVSKDNGQHWAAYSGEKQNNFPGTITAVVATQDADAIKAVDYDPNAVYATGNTLVRYNGFYWTNAWYANPGEAPGSNEVWKKGAAISVKTLGTFSFHAFTGQAATDFQKQLKDKVAAQRKIIGYFPEWGVYDAHNNFTTDKIDFSQITHLNYGFTVVRNGVVNVFDSEQGPKLMPDLAKRTAAAGVTNMISVGGYTNSEEGVFEAATKDAAGVEKLSQSIVDYMVKWGFGGVDIDWEYPDTVAEKAQFTSLIQSLRGKLDTLGKQNDAYYQLSAAVVANYKKIEFMNPAVTTPLLDSVNLMAYDFHGAFDPITGHNAGLFANKADPQDQKFNTASVAEIYANTWSVPKSKIMVGIPFYGRAWGNVAATEKVKGLPGLFTAGSPTVHGQWDDSGQFSGTNPYSLLKTWASNPDYTRYWDSEAKVPYLYNSKTKEFFTYDDKESVQAKVDYINQNGFGGAIIWDLSGDTPDHELGEVVDDIIENPTPTPTPTPSKDTNNTLYQNFNYDGFNVTITEDTPCLVGKYTDTGYSLNDVASSLKIGKDSLGVNMFSDCSYSGKKLSVTQNSDKFSKDMNDVVSSVKVIKAIAYQHFNFEGASLIIDGDISDLKGVNFNDFMSSIKVAEGYSARLFEHTNYEGKYIDVQPGSKISKLDFNDRVSSIKIIKTK